MALIFAGRNDKARTFSGLWKNIKDYIPIMDEDLWLAVFDLTDSRGRGSEIFNALTFKHAVCLCVLAQPTQSRTNVLHTWSKNGSPFGILKKGDWTKDPFNSRFGYVLWDLKFWTRHHTFSGSSSFRNRNPKRNEDSSFSSDHFGATSRNMCSHAR